MTAATSGPCGRSYLIAADGAHSPIRRRLGVEMLGHGSFSDSITIYFRADIRALLGDRNLSVIYVFHPRLVGFFRFSIDGDAGFLVVNATIDEEGNRSTAIGEDMSEETCVDYVRLALGAPDLPVQIENVQRWSATADWAERFAEGRILIAGDAAHVMPPTGGFGGQHGRPGRVRPGVEAPVRAGRHREPGAARHLRRRATAGRASSPSSRPTRGTCSGSIPASARRTWSRSSPRMRSSSATGTVSDAIQVAPDDDGLVWEDPHAPTARPGHPGAPSGRRT